MGDKLIELKDTNGKSTNIGDIIEIELRNYSCRRSTFDTDRDGNTYIDGCEPVEYNWVMVLARLCSISDVLSCEIINVLAIGISNYEAKEIHDEIIEQDEVKQDFPLSSYFKLYDHDTKHKEGDFVIFADNAKDHYRQLNENVLCLGCEVMIDKSLVYDCPHCEGLAEWGVIDNARIQVYQEYNEESVF